LGLLDIDHFKAVNDLYGHAMGDDVLRRLASVVSRSLRQCDFLARWGGEEFAALFPNTNLSQAHTALDKALTVFRAKQFTAPDGKMFQVAFSAGVVTVTPGATLEQMMAEADGFLYKAKTTGRGQVLCSDDNAAAFKSTVLVVEDDEFTASTLQYYLERHGLRVVRAKDGQSALTAAMDGTISFITLDVKISGPIDGFELLRRFRSMTSLRSVPILMVTSQNKQEDILRGFNLGVDDYIRKPFLPREILARIDRFQRKN
jgi:diguanylate cyclase (GGDEF)-like protein